ncbi:unnamed protein product [Tenebrio molitor]|nr:unnamed protein product [Tenebrio molitor]
MHRVSFIDLEPSEREYFEEYDKYNKISLWFILVLILRSFIPFCYSLQVGPFSFPKSVDVYIKEFSIQNVSFQGFPSFSICSKKEYFQDNNTILSYADNQTETECDVKNVALRMNTLKGFGYSLGALSGGVLADVFGRRITSFLFSIAWNVTSLVLVFVHSRILVESFYIIAVGCCSAVNVITLVNFAEIASKNNIILAVYTVPTYIFGDILFHFMTNGVIIWKHLMVMIASTIFIVVFACWYIPESPRWLFNKKKKKKAYDLLKEISGLKYKIGITETTEKNLRKATVFQKMFKFLFENKLKHFIISGLLVAISSLNYSCGKLRLILHDIPMREFGLLANVAETLRFNTRKFYSLYVNIFSSLLFVVPVYIFFGKRCGMFLTYILMCVEGLMALLAKESAEKIYYDVFNIFFGFSTLCLIWLYTLYLFPTFLRATALGYAYFIFGMTLTGGSFLVSEINILGEFNYYLILSLIGILGLTSVALPNISGQELSNTKLI